MTSACHFMIADTSDTYTCYFETIIIFEIYIMVRMTILCNRNIHSNKVLSLHSFYIYIFLLLLLFNHFEQHFIVKLVFVCTIIHKVLESICIFAGPYESRMPEKFLTMSSPPCTVHMWMLTLHFRIYNDVYIMQVLLAVFAVYARRICIIRDSQSLQLKSGSWNAYFPADRHICR